MKTFNVKLTAHELQQLQELRAPKNELTLNGLYNLAIKEHWSSPRYVASGWKKEVVNLYKRNMAGSIGKKRLSKLTVKEVRSWHKEMEPKPIDANRSLAVLSRLFAFAEEEGILSPGSNPCAFVSRFKEKKRKRYASPDEIRKVINILERELTAHPMESTFLTLLMLTGARPSSIARSLPSQVERIEIEGRTYGVMSFEGKTSEDSGEEEVVIIPPKGMELLDKLPKERNSLSGPIPRKFWERIREEAGCPDLWARDWRRTFATIGLSDGISSGIIGEVLNHRSAQTTKRYAHLLKLERFSAVAQISDKMEELVRP